VSRFPYLGALLGLNMSRFGKDGAPNSRRGPAGLRRRTTTGRADGVRGNPSAAAASGEEHHVWYIDESTRRACFDIQEHIVVIECVDPFGGACNRSTRWVWWGLSGDGGAVVVVESTRRSPGAVLDRELLCSRKEME
jgi:hypothetical protein